VISYLIKFGGHLVCKKAIVFLVALGLFFLIGCRSVWIHPEWEEGKYEADLTECSTQPNWKVCMVAKGWYTETGSRSDPRSRAPE
jgi:hypothetical protein